MPQRSCEHEAQPKRSRGAIATAGGYGVRNGVEVTVRGRGLVGVEHSNILHRMRFVRRGSRPCPSGENGTEQRGPRRKSKRVKSLKAKVSSHGMHRGTHTVEVRPHFMITSVGVTLEGEGEVVGGRG